MPRENEEIRLDIDRYQSALYELRRHTFHTVAIHENSPEHNGGVCWHERCNLIAFLCHSLRIDVDRFDMVVETLASYEQHHHQHKD